MFAPSTDGIKHRTVLLCVIGDSVHWNDGAVQEVRSKKLAVNNKKMLASIFVFSTWYDSFNHVMISAKRPDGHV